MFLLKWFDGPTGIKMNLRLAKRLFARVPFETMFSSEGRSPLTLSLQTSRMNLTDAQIALEESQPHKALSLLSKTDIKTSTADSLNVLMLRARSYLLLREQNGFMISLESVSLLTKLEEIEQIMLVLMSSYGLYWSTKECEYHLESLKPIVRGAGPFVYNSFVDLHNLLGFFEGKRVEPSLRDLNLSDGVSERATIGFLINTASLFFLERFRAGVPAEKIIEKDCSLTETTKQSWIHQVQFLIDNRNSIGLFRKILELLNPEIDFVSVLNSNQKVEFDSLSPLGTLFALTNLALIYSRARGYEHLSEKLVNLSLPLLKSIENHTLFKAFNWKLAILSNKKKLIRAIVDMPFRLEETSVWGEACRRVWESGDPSARRKWEALTGELGSGLGAEEAGLMFWLPGEWCVFEETSPETFGLNFEC